MISVKELNDVNTRTNGYEYIIKFKDIKDFNLDYNIDGIKELEIHLNSKELMKLMKALTPFARDFSDYDLIVEELKEQNRELKKNNDLIVEDLKSQNRNLREKNNLILEQNLDLLEENFNLKRKIIASKGKLGDLEC